MKLLLWVLVLVAVALWVLNAKKARLRREQQPPANPPPTLETEKMLCCAHCGVYIPDSEAFKAPERQLAYCSSEHRQLHTGAR